MNPAPTLPLLPRAVASRPAENDASPPGHRYGWREVLHLEVPGPPVGAMRPRFSRRGKHVATHMADGHVNQELMIVELARRAWRDRPPLEDLIRVEIAIVLERPRRLISKALGGTMTGPAERRLLAGAGSISGRLLGPAKPDNDNVEKLTWDGLQKAGVVARDERVVSNSAIKWFAAVGELPKTEVVVSIFDVPVEGRWW